MDHCGSAKEEQLSDDVPISDLTNEFNKLSLSITPSMTVTELETAF